MKSIKTSLKTEITDKTSLKTEITEQNETAIILNEVNMLNKHDGIKHFYLMPQIKYNKINLLNQ